ncbi:hypothetical protein Hanom_Chr01g00060391 [Helianthus anomalus]
MEDVKHVDFFQENDSTSMKVSTRSVQWGYVWVKNRSSLKQLSWGNWCNFVIM